MAQIVKLRRSAVTGQKPTNSNLLLGELAINTTDGKVFLAKSGSDGPSIEELISTNTVNTGSINLVGSITASNFVGNGAGITGVISSSYAVTSSYAGLAFTIQSTPGATQLLTVTTPSTTWYFNHNLGEIYPVIQVYDSNGFVVIPSSIEMFSENTAVITFSMAQSGFATATVGGGLPAISSSYDGRILQTDGVGASWNTITDMGFAITGSNSFNGNQTVTGSLNVSGSVTINTRRIDDGWTPYTPIWTASSTNPSIGNGTTEGYYKVIGKTCFVRGNIVIGSTTTFGSGEWYISMPLTASHADAILMTSTLLDNSSAWYNAVVAGARAGYKHKAPIQYQTTGGTAGDVNGTAPFAWANSDRFIWNGSYEIE